MKKFRNRILVLIIGSMIFGISIFAANRYENQFDKTWISQFGSTEPDSPRASAIDSAGNLIIVGQTSGDLAEGTTAQQYCSFIAKITSDGERSWTNQCQVGSLQYFNLVDVAVDEQNNIYALGTYDYDSDVMVFKLDTNANLIWSKAFGRSDATEEPKAMYRASDGNLYITGVVRGAAGAVFLSKLTADGQTVTTKEFGSLEGWTTAVSVDGDSQGNVYVTGIADGNFDGQNNSGNEDIFLTKFNTDGNKVWTKLFGSATAPENQLKSDLTRAMTIVNDIIYIAGDTQGNLGGQTNSGNYDMFVTKFSTDGGILGTIMQGGADLNNPGQGSADHVSGMTVTLDGAIYLYGTTTGQFLSSGENGNDYAQLILVKFKASGVYDWANQFTPNSGNSHDNAAVTIHKDSTDNLYLLAQAYQWFGGDYSSNFPNIAAFKLTEINSTKFSLVSSNKFSALDARGAVEKSGDIVVAGADDSLETYVSEFLFDMSLSGPRENYTAYGKYIPTKGHPIVNDPNNNTYVISYSDEDIPGQPANEHGSTVVTKYDNNGQVSWVKRFNSTEDHNIPTAIAYHDNKIFIVGYTEGNIDGTNDNNGSDSEYGLRRVDGFVLALNASDGTQVWVDQFSEGNTKIVMMRDVGVDANGYLHIVGGNDGYIVLNTYQTDDGTSVAFEQYGPGVSSESNMGLAINGTNLYIVGKAFGNFVPGEDKGLGDIFLTKIDKSAPAQGRTIWKKQRGTSTYDAGQDIAIGPDGNLYVVGFSSGNLDGKNAGGTDFILESYSSNGVLIASRQSGGAEDDTYHGVFVDSTGKGVVVSGSTDGSASAQQAILQRYTIHKSNLMENGSLVACINETLGVDSKHTPTLEELESIQSFTCNNKGVYTLSGIEYMVNLVHLDLGNNFISDLTPLYDLVHIQYLNLANNKIEDITPIAELKTISTLHLDGNKISDISILHSFTALETLTFSNNQIEDISALENMTYLKLLIMENNLISDVSPLHGLSSLETVYLSGNLIQDFSPIPVGVVIYGQYTQDIQTVNISPIISYLLD